MAWHEIERDTIGRITVIVFRCGGCERLGTASKESASSSEPRPSACVCATTTKKR